MGCLDLGVVVLALMAWRIWREVKKAAPYKTKGSRLREPFARQYADYELETFSVRYLTRLPEKRPSLLSLFPLRRANFAVLFVELQRASTIRSFISSMLRPSGQIVNHLVTNAPLASIRKEPRRATPSSGCSIPLRFLDFAFDVSNHPRI